MSSQQRISNLTMTLVLAVAFGLFVSGVPSTVMAIPPAKKDCAQQDVFERLACRQAALADQMEYTSDTAFAEGTRLHQRIKPGRLAHIKNAKQKTQRAKKKNTMEVFKRQAKTESQGNKKGGHLVPFDDVVDDMNGDGICDYEQGNDSAQCAAIELDESGNLQVCNPNKKNKGKGKGGGNPKFEGLECDVFFESEEGSTPAEEEDMEESAEQLEATYSTTEDNMIEMNEHLDIVNANLPDESAAVLAAQNGCVLPELTPGLADAAIALREIHAIVFGAARIAADFGGQDFVAFGFGGNTRTLAVAFDSIATAANVVFIALDESRRAESSELQTAISDCVSQSAGEIAALQTQVLELQVQIQQEHDEIMANDNANMATILSNLEQVRAELAEILNTPLGVREEFPVK
ncbi:MAG: hypothetical protein OEU74_00325 [Gammaproteobacteria bacterium]|nr:hypothetical protein [Gammaproteobacteria bacterium]